MKVSLSIESARIIIKNPSVKEGFCVPGRTWTYNLLVRSQTLYPIELRGHIYFFDCGRLLGIEPRYLEPQPNVLPLNDSRHIRIFWKKHFTPFCTLDRNRTYIKGLEDPCSIHWATRAQLWYEYTAFLSFSQYYTHVSWGIRSRVFFLTEKSLDPISTCRSRSTSLAVFAFPFEDSRKTHTTLRFSHPYVSKILYSLTSLCAVRDSNPRPFG